MASTVTVTESQIQDAVLDLARLFCVAHFVCLGIIYACSFRHVANLSVRARTNGGTRSGSLR
jgi:hypothetical protein